MYSKGPWFDKVAGNRGNAEQIVRWALFYIKTEPAIQGVFPVMVMIFISAEHIQLTQQCLQQNYCFHF